MKAEDLSIKTAEDYPRFGTMAQELLAQAWSKIERAKQEYYSIVAKEYEGEKTDIFLVIDEDSGSEYLAIHENPKEYAGLIEDRFFDMSKVVRISQIVKVRTKFENGKYSITLFGEDQ